MASDKKVRGFRFFFWVSASLFILAAANWIFNTFIGISNLVSNSLGFGVSNATSYLLGVGILLLAILFVASFLNLVYNAVPDVRDILNGVLGLGKESEGGATSPAEGTKGKRPTYVEIVKNDPRIKVEDIGLFFSSEMDHYGSFWLFFVGISIGMLETLLILIVTIGTGPVQSVVVYLGYLTVASVGGLAAFAVGFWLISARFGKDPSTVRAKRFKEYLDAKDAIVQRDKKNESGGNS